MSRVAGILPSSLFAPSPRRRFPAARPLAAPAASASEPSRRPRVFSLPPSPSLRLRLRLLGARSAAAPRRSAPRSSGSARNALCRACGAILSVRPPRPRARADHDVRDDALGGGGAPTGVLSVAPRRTDLLASSASARQSERARRLPRARARAPRAPPRSTPRRLRRRSGTRRSSTASRHCDVCDRVPGRAPRFWTTAVSGFGRGGRGRPRTARLGSAASTEDSPRRRGAPLSFRRRPDADSRRVPAARSPVAYARARRRSAASSSAPQGAGFGAAAGRGPAPVHRLLVAVPRARATAPPPPTAPRSRVNRYERASRPPPRSTADARAPISAARLVPPRARVADRTRTRRFHRPSRARGDAVRRGTRDRRVLLRRRFRERAPPRAPLSRARRRRRGDGFPRARARAVATRSSTSSSISSNAVSLEPSGPCSSSTAAYSPSHSRRGKAMKRCLRPFDARPRTRAAARSRRSRPGGPRAFPPRTRPPTRRVCVPENARASSYLVVVHAMARSASERGPAQLGASLAEAAAGFFAPKRARVARGDPR